MYNLIKLLRKKTYLSIIECKKALLLNNLNLEKAEEYLINNYNYKFNKNYNINNGCIISLSKKNIIAIIIIKYETDFIKNDYIKKFAKDILNIVIKNKIDNINLILKLKIKKNSIKNYLHYLNNKFKERILINKIYYINSNYKLIKYIHHNYKIGSIIEYISYDNNNMIIKDIAMHIVAMTPLFLNINNIPRNILENKYILYKINNIKYYNYYILSQIINNNIKKYLKNTVLLLQYFIKNNKINIKKLIKINNIIIKSFILLKI